MENKRKKYHIARTVPKLNRKILETNVKWIYLADKYMTCLAWRDRHGYDSMVIVFTAIYAISAYHY